MNEKSITVSDHALVRWMQRTGMADLDPVREALEASLDRAAQSADLLGISSYLILADGLVYVVRDSVLVTVIEEDSRHGHCRALVRRKSRGEEGGGSDA